MFFIIGCCDINHYDLVQVVAVLKGHTKKVNRVVYHPTEDTAITGSFDTTVRVWNVPTAQTIQMLRLHDGPITGLSLHATGKSRLISNHSDLPLLKSIILSRTMSVCLYRRIWITAEPFGRVASHRSREGL